MFIGSGKRSSRKQGREKKGEGERREKESDQEEVPRKRSAGVGGLRRGSEGPMPRILLCGCGFGLAQVPEGGVPERPLAWRHSHFDLSPLSRPHYPPSPGACAPGPSRPSLPAARGLGLTVWAAVAALLARSGGRAMGEGGPVPTPLRGAPAPSPGEA